MREEKYKARFLLAKVVYSLFMSDSLYYYIHKTFFASKRNGLFIEVGGLNGVAHDSSSFFYMRGI
jgi:hypothetical protein